MKKGLSVILLAALLLSCLGLSGCSGVKSRFFSEYAQDPTEAFSRAVFPVKGLFNGSGTISTLTAGSENLIPDGMRTFEMQRSDGSASFRFDTGVQMEIYDNDIIIEGLLDKIIKIPISDFFVCDVSSICAAFKSIAQTLEGDLRDIQKVSVSVASDNGGESITAKIGREDSVQLLSTLFDQIKSPFNAECKTLLQKAIFEKNGIGAGTADQYLDNLLARLCDFDLSIQWQRTLKDGKIVGEVFSVCSELPEYDFSCAYSCDGGVCSLKISDVFELYTDGATLRMIFGETTFEAQTEQQDPAVTLNIRYETPEDAYTSDLFYTFADDGSAYGVKGSFQSDDGELMIEFAADMKQTDVLYHISVDEYYVLSNNIAGAPIYDRVMARLGELFPPFASVAPAAIAIESPQADSEAEAWIDGQPYPSVYYRYIAQQNRDYYELNAGIQWPDLTYQQALNEPIETGERLGDYINSVNKQSYLMIYCIEREFERLGLNLTLSQLRACSENLNANYPEDVRRNYCEALGLSDAMFRGLYAACFYKQQLVNDWYWGAAGENRVSLEQIRQSFDSDYLGIQYIVKYTVSYGNQSLSDDEIETIHNTLSECKTRLDNGEITMEDAVLQYSEDRIDEDTIALFDDAQQAEMRAVNDLLAKGVIVDPEGHADSANSIVLPPQVVEAAQALAVGQITTLDTEVGSWIVRRVDIGDRFNEKVGAVAERCASVARGTMYEQWIAGLDVRLSDALVRDCSPENLKTMDTTTAA